VAANPGRGISLKQLNGLIKDKFGTVGAVALDSNGNLAAATSTGGMTNKQFGRVGDVPIIGSGTFANHVAAISATGWGEQIMRNVISQYHRQLYGVQQRIA
jgi:L-asparaginase / beta-aspartyl-peptidase